jgi:hypothetical protein
LFTPSTSPFTSTSDDDDAAAAAASVDEATTICIDDDDDEEEEEEEVEYACGCEYAEAAAAADMGAHDASSCDADVTGARRRRCGMLGPTDANERRGALPRKGAGASAADGCWLIIAARAAAFNCAAVGCASSSAPSDGSEERRSRGALAGAADFFGGGIVKR